MNNKSILLAACLAISFPLFAPAAQAFTVYTIDIQQSFIKASADSAVVELKMADDTLVVSAVPKSGFYGLKVGDRITTVNDIAIHGTNAFIEALNKSADSGADVSLERGKKILKLTIPKKGYSWFL